ncbi:hypothetical protein [Desulfosporosinus orientis]|nr:hypothetical protein [Desulfosporosinus orientis]
MAELGYVDTEFTMYGAAYLGLDNEMKYIISGKRDEIYKFIETSAYDNFCPSAVKHYSENCPVPSGYEEEIAQQVKFRLAKKLQQDYKKPIFESLKYFAQMDGNDAAYDLLLAEQENLEGLFDRDALVVFEGLVDLAFQKKLLSRRSLNEFQKWIRKVKLQMEDDLIIKDIMEKTLYACVYRAEGILKYYINAQYDSICAFVLKAQKQGYRPSPLFYKTYYFNYRYTLIDAKKDFKVILEKLLDEEYMKKLEVMNTMRSVVSGHEYRMLSDNYNSKIGSGDLEIIKKYGIKWNVKV